MSLAVFSETLIAPAVTGTWGRTSFPDVVTIQGREFRRAGWKMSYPNVVEQYRETVPRFSQHLKVYADGHWAIDHIDDENPDMGRAVAHFFRDYAPGKAVHAAWSIFGLSAGVYALSKMFQTKRNPRWQR